MTLPFDPEDLLDDVFDSPFGILNDAIEEVDDIAHIILITHSKDGKARVATLTNGIFHSLGMIEYAKAVLANRAIPYD